MPSYVVESYLAASAAAAAEACDRARRAADPPTGIRHVRTMFVPEDEMVLHVFEAPSAAAVRRAAQHAALQYERIVEAIETAESGREDRDT